MEWGLCDGMGLESNSLMALELGERAKPRLAAVLVLELGVHSSFVFYSSQQFALKGKLLATTLNLKTLPTSCLLPICLISLDVIQSFRFWRLTASHFHLKFS